MHLQELCLRKFRNYEGCEIGFSPQINVIVGPNAQGKTNILEAIYLLALGRSFRTANEHELIKHGEQAFRLVGRFQSNAGVSLTIDYRMGPETKEIFQNGMSLRRAQDLFGQVRLVLFSPDDLQLLKGGPEFRRTYLDLCLAQTNPRYRRALAAFSRLCAQRNSQLKRIRDGIDRPDHLAIWNETLIEKAAEMAQGRIAALAELEPLVASYHRRLAGGAEEISLAYRLGGHTGAADHPDLVDYYQREIRRREQEEIARGMTLVGPHRDDLGIDFASGHDLRSFGSQGQQRTAALALKLAAVDYLQNNTGDSPIILLDDVLSEFDDHRKRALLHLLLETNQTVITATNRRDFGEANYPFRSFRVEDGRIREETEG